MTDTSRARISFCRPLAAALLAGLIAAGVVTHAKAEQPPADDLHAALEKSLAARGWVDLPKRVADVRYSGPTRAARGEPPSPAWFLTHALHPNGTPRADDACEQAFVRSIAAVHAGKTRLVEGGVVLLVDAKRRVWCVAAHMPHLLRCYDGKGWTHRRADGLPAAADEPAVVARLAAEGKLPQVEFTKGVLRDLNDFGAWYTAACADAAGNLHFVAACVSRDAADRAARQEPGVAAGGGVHTLRADGSWSFFRILPPEMSRFDMRLEKLRWVVHAAPPAGGAGVDAGPTDLVTLAEFQLSDPVAKLHGHGVEPMPPGSDELRRQQWKDHTDEPRDGPVYLLRFDGRAWRFDRSSVGWGGYDAVHRTWPQPDGRAYLANRFGLWEQWPANFPNARLDRLIADLFEVDEGTQSRAAQTLVAMGRISLPALRDAAKNAGLEATRRRLADLVVETEKVARGEEATVPVVGGRWRFFRAYPQATMPDGRFAFTCERVVDVRENLEMKDCLVTFNPAAAADNPDGFFEVRPIDRGQWNTTDFYDKRANEPPVKDLDGTVLDLGGGLWVPGGYRCGPDGRITRLVPAGFDAPLPQFVDPEGRVYFAANSPNAPSLHFLRPAAAAGEVAAVEKKPDGEAETRIDGVRGVFRQPDLAPPWNAWAIQSRDGRPDLLLRLDGREPTPLELPPAIRTVSAVVPLDGGCVVAGKGPAGYWDGEKWDVAPNVRTLVQRYGAEWTKTLPTRAFSADTSAVRFDNYEYQLMLAADGLGGVWVAEDTPIDPGAGPPRGVRRPLASRQLWHWDGDAFTGVWGLLPGAPEMRPDGAVMTAEGGRALIVQAAQTMVRPGGVWAVRRVARENRERPRGGPPAPNPPGLSAALLAVVGPNTGHFTGLWVDRSGWVWSPLVSLAGGGQWWRRHGESFGATALDRFASPGTLAQGREGPAWWVGGRMRDAAAVWADVGPVGDGRAHDSRMTWVGAEVPGMGAAARLAIGPDDKVYLLHEAGCSLLRLRKLADGEKPKLPARAIVPPATTRPSATQPAAPKPAAAGDAPPQAAGGAAPALPWEIEEIARRKWDGPRNDFDRIAFDATGVWFFPANGPLIRAPLPRE